MLMRQRDWAADKIMYRTQRHGGIYCDVLLNARQILMYTKPFSLGLYFAAR